MKEETLGHWFSKYNSALRKLVRETRARANPFLVSEIPPVLLSKNEDVPRSFSDEHGREWYMLRMDGKVQYAVAQLLVGTGVPVAPVVKVPHQEGGYRYYSYRIPSTALEGVANDVIEDVWASDMILRYVFSDTDRSVYPGSEHNILREMGGYYLFDFGDADFYADEDNFSQLLSRMRVFQKDFHGDGIHVLILFRERVMKLIERLRGKEGLQTLTQALDDLYGKNNMKPIIAIRKRLLKHLQRALSWTEKYLGK